MHRTLRPFELLEPVNLEEAVQLFMLKIKDKDLIIMNKLD